jgi:hexokinase
MFDAAPNVLFLAAAATAMITRWKKRNSTGSNPSSVPAALSAFALSREELDCIRTAFHEAMRRGLAGDPSSTIPMIPSFVTRLPTGQETGTFWAIDLGGTNLRVVRVPLSTVRGGYGEMLDHKIALPTSTLTGDAEQLFGFIAHEIKAQGVSSGDRLAFTFSFPLDQTGIASGKLLEWTKGFSTTGVIGRDVARLLESALLSEGLLVSVCALVNDTVGTLMAAAYERNDARMGVILGTGNNACYLERLRDVPKWRGEGQNDPQALMVINMEWGGFGSEARKLDASGNMYLRRASPLPLTAVDDAVDAVSPNAGRQRFEKAISGLYLGELARLAVGTVAREGPRIPNRRGRVFRNPCDRFSQDFLDDNASAKTGRLSLWELPPSISGMQAFETRQAAAVERDASEELSEVRAVLEAHGVNCGRADVADLALFQRCCVAVSSRAAALCAVAVSCVVARMRAGGVPMGAGGTCTVGVDGSVYEKYPNFKNRMETELARLGCERVVLIHARDGSGKGAALVAATTV